MRNPSDAASRGELHFRRNGTDGASPAAVLAWSLGAFETKSWTDVVAAMGADGIGSLDVIVDEGATPLVVTRAFDDDREHGTKGVSIAMLRPSDALEAGQSAAIIAPADPEAARLNIGIRALASGATIRVRVHTPTGAIRVDRGEITYGPHASLQQTAAELTGTAMQSGESISIAVVRGAVFAYGTMTDNRTNDPSIQLPMPRNHVPRMEDVVVDTDQAGRATITLTATDDDDEHLIFTIPSTTSRGSLGAARRVDRRTVEVDYAADGDGGETDSFAVRVDDENGGSAEAEVMVIVAGATNQPPSIAGRWLRTDEDVAIDVAVTALDPEGSDVTGAPVSAGRSGRGAEPLAYGRIGRG